MATGVAGDRAGGSTGSRGVVRPGDRSLEGSLDRPLDGPGEARADGATLASIFVLTQMIVPARLVVKGLGFSLTPADLLALGMGLAWLCAQCMVGFGAAKGRTPVRTAISIYVVAGLATYCYANSGYLPSDERNFSDHSLVLLVALAGLGYAVVDGVPNRRRLDLVLKTVVVGGAVIGLIGALQYLLNLDLTQYLAKLPGLRSTSDDVAVLVRGEHNRVASTTGHPIEFGVVSSMVLPLAAHYGFQARERGLPALRWWACAALIGSGLMFSVSRSAVLTIAGVGLVLVIGWPQRRRVQALVVGVLFLGFVKATSPGLVSTIYKLFANAGTDSSVQVRTHRYTQAAEEISKHFWLGRGAGTWYFPKYNAFDNQYIMSMVETGLIGTVALVLLFVLGIWSAGRARYLSADPETRDLGLTLAACLVSPLLGAATFDMLSFHTVTGLSFVLVGASGALLRDAAREPRPVSERQPVWLGNALRWRQGVTARLRRT